MREEIELLVADALVIDGSGAPGRPGTVVVRGDCIEAILGPGATEPVAARRFDAGGMVLAAARFGLSGRGEIRKGAFADLVVFDPERVADRATFDHPHAFAEGIDLVVVNGKVAWDGAPGERAGRALRRGEA